jgi:hypothetical protein
MKRIVAIFGISLTLSPALSIAGSRSFATAADADAALRAAGARLQEGNRCLASVLARNRENLDEYAKLAEEADQLGEERDRAIRELKAGRYCSRCRRTATEIEKSEKVPFQVHLGNVKGSPVAASAAEIGRRAKEYDDKIWRLYGRISVVEQDNRQLWWKSFACQDQQQQARFDISLARRWSKYLKSIDQSRLRQQGNKVPQLNAATFGLPANASRSEYEVLRLYPQPGKGPVRTLRPDSDILPSEDIKFARYHRGIDFGTQDESVPFVAGVEGTAYIVEGSKNNAIRVDLENGNRLVFLHADTIKIEDPEGKGVPVKHDTVLGLTGHAGAEAIHLHVQAEDPKGNPLDPEIAILDRDSDVAKLYREAWTEVDSTRPFTAVQWAVNPQARARIGNLMKGVGASGIFEKYYVNSPVVVVP